MNKKLLKGKIMNIKRIIVLVLISASSGLLCAQRKTVNMSDRYGILTVTPLDKYTGAACPMGMVLAVFLRRYTSE